MEQTNTFQINPLKFYKAHAIWVGTFLGGPLAAGYFISQNFKALGEVEKIRKTWIITAIATIMIFSVVWLIPEDVNLPNQLIPFLYTLVGYYTSKKLQGAGILAQVSCGAGYHSWWRVIGISIGSALILLTILFVFVLLLP